MFVCYIIRLKIKMSCKNNHGDDAAAAADDDDVDEVSN
jgi:hypothetical protein